MSKWERKAAPQIINTRTRTEVSVDVELRKQFGLSAIGHPLDVSRGGIVGVRARHESPTVVLCRRCYFFAPHRQASA